MRQNGLEVRLATRHQVASNDALPVSSQGDSDRLLSLVRHLEFHDQLRIDIRDSGT